MHAPANIDAERRVIAKALSTPGVSWTMIQSRGLTAEMFFVPAHHTVFAVMESMFRDNLYPDRDLLSSRLREMWANKSRGITVYDWVGGGTWLRRLFKTKYACAHYADDIQDVIDWYRLRREWARLDERMQ